MSHTQTYIVHHLINSKENDDDDDEKIKENERKWVYDLTYVPSSSSSSTY